MPRPSCEQGLTEAVGGGKRSDSMSPSVGRPQDTGRGTEAPNLGFGPALPGLVGFPEEWSAEHRCIPLEKVPGADSKEVPPPPIRVLNHPGPS